MTDQYVKTQKYGYFIKCAESNRELRKLKNQVVFFFFMS